jgi:antirestriction protein
MTVLSTEEIEAIFEEDDDPKATSLEVLEYFNEINDVQNEGALKAFYENEPHYWSNETCSTVCSAFEDAYYGTYESEEDWAENHLVDTGALNEIPENLRWYFDYKLYARDARLGGDVYFIEEGGDTHVFRS